MSKHGLDKTKDVLFVYFQPWWYNQWPIIGIIHPKAVFLCVLVTCCDCAHPSPDRDISYSHEHIAALSVHSCSVPLEDSLSELAALLKLPGFTLCHFEQNRPTSDFRRVHQIEVMTWISEPPLWICEYFLLLVALNVCFQVSCDSSGHVRNEP